MFKNNYIKLSIVSLTVLLSFLTFLSTRHEHSNIGSLIVPISLILVLPIFMHYKYKSVKKTKFKIPYLVVMVILYIFNLFVFVSLIFEIFVPMAYTIEMDIFSKFNSFKDMFSVILFMMVLWFILFLSFDDLDKEEAKTNYILTIFVSLIIVLIHINFYINPYLYPLVGYNISGENALYITQNYSYFTLMYTAIIINKIRGNWLIYKKTNYLFLFGKRVNCL